jgi:hypothetical protein
MPFIALNTRLPVSHWGAIANLRSGALLTLIDPNTTIKIMGNNSEKTIEVGLLNVASKLYLEMARAALTWLAGLVMQANIIFMAIDFYLWHIPFKCIVTLNLLVRSFYFTIGRGFFRQGVIT